MIGGVALIYLGILPLWLINKINKKNTDSESEISPLWHVVITVY
jgi:hypothetical protein